MFNRLGRAPFGRREKGNCPTNYKAWAAACIRFQESIALEVSADGQRAARVQIGERELALPAGRVATIDRLGAR